MKSRIMRSIQVPKVNLNRQFVQKSCFQSKIEEVKIIMKYNIFTLMQVQKLAENDGFNFLE